MARAYVQDPQEKLDYSISYAADLPDGDNVADSVWTVPDGITISGETMSGQSVSATFTGGTVGQEYVLRNTATSVDGRIVKDYIVLRIRAAS